MSSAETTGDGQPGIGRAYVSADSGIAVAVDGATTAPDQIYVEFSEPVVVGGADGQAVPADGFSLDGTLAGVETVERGAVAGDPDGTGSRVLVLTLSTGITAAEKPTLSYRPEPGDVETPSGAEPAPVTDLPVTPGSPRVLDVSVLAGRGDAVRIQFDRPITSRTDDATMFTLTDSDGESLLEGDVTVGWTRVLLPLTRDVTGELGDGSNYRLAYREGGSDTERMHNLVGLEGALVRGFSEPLDFSVRRGGFEILEASVPKTPNGSGNIDRTRLQLWFGPSMSADSAAGYELANTLAAVTGLGSADADDPGSPDVTLTLDAPIDPTDEPDAAVQYDPARGDTSAAGNETPDQPLSAEVAAIASPPAPRSARLSPDGESISVEFGRAVRSQHEDATGLKLSGAGGIELSGRVEEGEQLTLGLSEPLDLNEASNTVKLSYTTQGNSGPQYNLLGESDGMPAQPFTVAVERADETPNVERVRIPQDQRDRVVVRFDRPVTAENAAGFSLDGPIARVEELASVDGMDDDVKPYTVVLGLHVDVSTDSATLSYDADAGTVEGSEGGSPDGFEADVEMLPPAPTLERATSPADEAEIHVGFDRSVTLNRGDATGFDLGYEADEDGLATLTGRASAEGGTVVLDTDGPVDLPAEPILEYEPDDEGPNVLGTADGVAAGQATVRVAEGEGVDGRADPGADDGQSADEPSPGDGVATIVDADVPETEPDHVVCTFDRPVEEDASAFTVEGAATRVVGTVDTGGADELTLELVDPVPEGETVTVVYSPSE